MKFFRSTLFICALSVFAITLLGVQQTSSALEQGDQNAENICFRWAFGALTTSGSAPELVNITGDTTLKSGDRFMMLLELEKKCFVYLIYQGANGEVSLIFPHYEKQTHGNIELMKKYYIPREDQWFVLDENVGRETFYLLASNNRLTELENLFGAYDSSGPTQKTEASAGIVAEIHKLIREHKSFAAVAERPVSIGGTVRGKKGPVEDSGHDIEKFALEISATDFFYKAFSIEHK